MIPSARRSSTSAYSAQSCHCLQRALPRAELSPLSPRRPPAQLLLDAHPPPRGCHYRVLLPCCSDNHAKTRPCLSCPIRVRSMLPLATLLRNSPSRPPTVALCAPMCKIIDCPVLPLRSPIQEGMPLVHPTAVCCPRR
jgi:hypothetical protein